MRALILITLFVTGCASLPPKPVNLPLVESNLIDPVFNPIVQMFVYEAQSRGHSVDLSNLKMRLGNARLLTDDKTVGYCLIGRQGASIVIHEPTWAKIDDAQQEELLFHEMAHCLMGREHCGKQNDIGPVSIMFPKLIQSDYYTMYREDLVDELFSIDSRCVGDDGAADEEHGPLCSPSNLKRAR